MLYYDDGPRRPGGHAQIMYGVLPQQVHQRRTPGCNQTTEKIVVDYYWLSMFLAISLRDTVSMEDILSPDHTKSCALSGQRMLNNHWSSSIMPARGVDEARWSPPSRRMTISCSIRKLFVITPRSAASSLQPWGLQEDPLPLWGYLSLSAPSQTSRQLATRGSTLTTSTSLAEPNAIAPFTSSMLKAIGHSPSPSPVQQVSRTWTNTARGKTLRYSQRRQLRPTSHFVHLPAPAQ
ncbi:hypothetical protein BDK51DRAFT_43680 [Blyttiomyces helicus]|uniref:Uncharacterized protein n=1 Tax=Blyttiomyces helicus TaxID=388810 RepID=A0A4P9WLY6_9FUNG|nr:hypothetical protein BDK51DRAFT_43680 [Blyttiomyces helicus]|eukprot:RKO91696.1 hypothetical protein BDK51DRAFT_43680 [Blyttiomyces helicus]